MKRADLSAASTSIAPPRWCGLFAIRPTGLPSMRASAVTMPAPKPARNSSSEPVSATPRIAARTSYTRSRFSGTTWRSVRGSAHCQSLTGPWKYDRYCLAAATAAASSSTRMSITPLRDCTLLGPICSGAKVPRPPPSIIAGPLMPMLLPLVAMITSAQPSSAALPAKQRPCTMPTTGTLPDSAANWLKVWLFRPATIGMSVSPGRPPPPSANSTTGSLSWCATASSRSVLWWLRMPCVPASTV
ncbi:hypothetical protein D9M68_535250 [compost metagenome]